MAEKRFRTLISHIPYLYVLSFERKKQLYQAAIHRFFVADEVIFLEDDEAAGLWIIESGQVKIAKLSMDGNEYILHLLNEGDSFNDIAALEKGVNPATATALSDVKCWLIPTEVIQQILETDPQAAKAAISMLTTRVRLLVQQLENLALYSVTARLARFLLQQAETSIIEGGVTRAAIAAHLATTPETISRALRTLEQAGAIEFTRHQIQISHPEILQALALIEPS